MNLDDLRIATCVVVMIFILLVAMASGMAHCMDASPQTNCEVVSLYIKYKNPRLPKKVREYIAYEIIHQSINAGISYETITAIMCIESCYDPSAVGPMGELGLMQIYTMECIGGGIEKIKIEKALLFDIEYNIAAGICILLDKLKAANGDVILAIRKYNGSGPAANQFRDKVCKVILDMLRFRVANKDKLMLRDALSVE